MPIAAIRLLCLRFGYKTDDVVADCALGPCRRGIDGRLPVCGCRSRDDALHEFAGRKVIFYFQPWEFDVGHPRPSYVTPCQRLSHYSGLGSARREFLHVLNDFAMGTLCAVKRPDGVMTNPLQPLRVSAT